MRSAYLFPLFLLILPFAAASHYDDSYYDDRYRDDPYYDRYSQDSYYERYDPYYTDRYDDYDDRYRYDAGYAPRDAYYSHSRYPSRYDDPVIYGGLGNYYYDGYYVGSGHPLARSRYVPFGNIYRYDLSYGYSYYSCYTGCPGWGAD